MLYGLLLAAVEVMAVYYPHWHSYPKGNEWFKDRWDWSEGEWAFVKDAKPRFSGHQQPIVPLPGYLDGKNPTDVAKEIELAADAGITAFLYDYYYYDGQFTQEEAIEEGFLKAPNRNRLKFALMWCYHDRNMRWRPKKFREENPLRLMTLARTSEEFLGLIDLSIARYFNRPEYYRRDGKLFFSIYNAPQFVEAVGTNGVRKALSVARRKVRAAGLGEIEFNAQNAQSLGSAALLKDVGFDSLTHYNANPIPRLRERMYEEGTMIFDYGETTRELEKRYEIFSAAELPYYPSVSTGWDATPRCDPSELFPWRRLPKGQLLQYPYGMVLTNCTAALFERNLRQAKAYADRLSKGGTGIVYVNAWNEYTEGCYLLPDNWNGDSKLRALERVFVSPRTGLDASCAREDGKQEKQREQGGCNDH